MYEIEIDRTFSAAHQLKGYPGPCASLHGHNYGVTAAVEAGELNAVGIALDFKLLKSALDEILKRYDHHNLSELPEFQETNPSSEVLAKNIFRELSLALNDGNVRVKSICVAESSGSRITYSE